MVDQDPGLIYGRHPVAEALAAGRVTKLWISSRADKTGMRDILEKARARKIVFQWADPSRLDAMTCGATHQGLVARAAGLVFDSFDGVLSPDPTGTVVILDGLEDPGNVGAVIRSAAFFGAAAVVLPRWRSAGLSSAVIKASAGAASKIKLAQVANVAEALSRLKERGYWVYGADAKGEDASRATIHAPSVLVIGAEHEGLHRLVRERCDGLLSLPGTGVVESLNAATAAGILLWELRRRRTA